MTVTIKKLSQVELSENLGLDKHLDSNTDTSTPSPWGIARLIRREVRRRGLALIQAKLLVRQRQPRE